MVTVVGLNVTMHAGFDVRVTLAPPAGAGALKLTEPLTVRVSPMPAGRVRVIEGFDTLMVAVPAKYPGAVASTFELPTATGVTVTFTAVAPEGMVTVEGMDTTAGSNVNDTTTPPLPATVPNATFSVPGEVTSRFNGFGDSVTFMATAVTVTVAGALDTKPSFTMSCAT